MFLFCTWKASECEFRHTQCQRQQYMMTELTLDHAGPCVMDAGNQIMVRLMPPIK